jgi:hypothetical protein
MNGGIVHLLGWRWSNGELISTSLVESTVNVLISKRFCKKQQMQWTPEGAHLSVLHGKGRGDRECIPIVVRFGSDAA